MSTDNNSQIPPPMKKEHEAKCECCGVSLARPGKPPRGRKPKYCEYCRPRILKVYWGAKQHWTRRGVKTRKYSQA